MRTTFVRPKTSGIGQPKQWVHNWDDSPTRSGIQWALKMGKIDGCCVPPLVIPLTIKWRTGLLSNLMGCSNNEESLFQSTIVHHSPPVHQSLTSKPNCFKVCWKSSMDSSSLFTSAGIPPSSQWFGPPSWPPWLPCRVCHSLCSSPGTLCAEFHNLSMDWKPSNLGGCELSLKPEGINPFWEISLWNPLS